MPKEHEPIGCRDLSMLKLLEAEGVNAYFSGCTLVSMQKKKVDAADREESLLIERTSIFGLPSRVSPRICGRRLRS
jgi:hypothetical protein